jgi:hypothetical protein
MEHCVEVYFYHPDFSNYTEDQILALEEDWRYFATGPKVWIVQTYIRLKKAGYPVIAISEPPKTGVVVLHYEQFTTFWNSAPSTRGIVTVVVRADRIENKFSDFEVLQNQHFADEKKLFFIPHWPQPNIIQRNNARGTTIKNIAFKGFLSNLHPILESDEWKQFLAQRNIEWIADGQQWDSLDARYDLINWNDYSETDLIVALRQDLARNYPDKPASKLINGWTAQVPCILGPEIAYQELRRSELDYIEVNDLKPLMVAVDHLINNPDVYQKMISNGISRAKEFSVDSIIERWGKLLFEKIIPQASRPVSKLYYSLSIGERRKFKQLISNS